METTTVAALRDEVGLRAAHRAHAGEMRCNLNSSIMRADASVVQVTAPDGAVVLDAAV